MNEIEQQIVDFFRDQNPLDADDISLSTRFKEDLDFTSLDLVDMRAQVLIFFGIHIEIERLATMKRIEDLTSYIHELQENNK